MATDTPTLLSTLPALCSISAATVAMPACRDRVTSSWWSRRISASARLRSVMSRENRVTPMTSLPLTTGCAVVSRWRPPSSGGSSKVTELAPARMRSRCGRQRSICAAGTTRASSSPARGSSLRASRRANT